MLDVGLQFSTPAARVNIARMRECVFQSHAAKQECAIRQGCLAKAAWQQGIFLYTCIAIYWQQYIVLACLTMADHTSVLSWLVQ
jgi:hypothetical protein